MEKAEQIRERLNEMAAQYGPAATLIAVVDSVDEENETCTLDDDGLLIYEVRLRALITGNENIIIVPKAGSYVLALRIENSTDWMILSCDQIGSYKIVAGNSSFEMDGEKFLIKNDSDDFKSMMDDYFTAILNMKFTTNTGVTITLVNALDFENLKTRFDNFFKSN